MSKDDLPVDDCHHELRKDYLEANPEYDPTLCISVAWDWYYIGSTKEVMLSRLQALLDADDVNRKNSRQSLAKPSFTIMRMAAQVLRDISSPFDDEFSINLAAATYKPFKRILDRETQALVQFFTDFLGENPPEIVNFTDYSDQIESCSFDDTAYAKTSYICKKCQAEICHYYLPSPPDQCVCLLCAANDKESQKLGPIRQRYYLTKQLEEFANLLEPLSI